MVKQSAIFTKMTAPDKFLCQLLHKRVNLDPVMLHTSRSVKEERALLAGISFVAIYFLLFGKQEEKSHSYFEPPPTKP